MLKILSPEEGWYRNLDIMYDFARVIDKK